jgi:hypothetical protein
VLSACMLLVSTVVCVLLVEMGCFKFWSFNVDVDVMRVYLVGADGHMSSCLGDLFFSAFCGGLTGRVRSCYSLLVSSECSGVYLWCCFWFFVDV